MSWDALSHDIKEKVEPKCLHLRLNLTSLILCLCVHTIFLIELIDTSASCSSLLLASIERMALGANLHEDIFLGRTSYRKEVSFMEEILVTFLVSVLAGVVSYYICKWLDGRH